MLSTHNMGGVSVQPSELRAMLANDYILHARDGKLEKVPVRKVRLPRDPRATRSGSAWRGRRTCCRWASA